MVEVINLYVVLTYTCEITFACNVQHCAVFFFTTTAQGEENIVIIFISSGWVRHEQKQQDNSELSRGLGRHSRCVHASWRQVNGSPL